MFTTPHQLLYTKKPTYYKNAMEAIGEVERIKNSNQWVNK